MVEREQTGFIKDQDIFKNILNVASSLDYASHSRKKMLLMKFDFDKAYDRLRWNFMLKVLLKLGFGEVFCKMIGSLFSNASAILCLNGWVIGHFNLCRSVRQVCPMAPLLPSANQICS